MLIICVVTEAGTRPHLAKQTASSSELFAWNGEEFSRSAAPAQIPPPGSWRPVSTPPLLEIFTVKGIPPHIKNNHCNSYIRQSTEHSQTPSLKAVSLLPWDPVHHWDSPSAVDSISTHPASSGPTSDCCEVWKMDISQAPRRLLIARAVWSPNSSTSRLSLKLWKLAESHSWDVQES